ncbi:MAG: hypothetical protein ABSG41_27280 [Bryobacteraceae bacterium]|jgi:thioesterase domain-containing protein
MRFDPDEILSHAVRAVEEANGIALRNYLPGPYPGRITQVRSTCGFTGFDLKRHGWVEFAANLESHEIPGSEHLGIISEPHVARVAEILKESIEKARP